MAIGKLVVQLLVLTLGAAYALELAADENRNGNQTLELKERHSGWWNWSEAADVDGDLQGGSHNDYTGSGSAGRFTSGGRSTWHPGMV